MGLFTTSDDCLAPERCKVRRRAVIIIVKLLESSFFRLLRSLNRMVFAGCGSYREKLADHDSVSPLQFCGGKALPIALAATDSHHLGKFRNRWADRKSTRLNSSHVS